MLKMGELVKMKKFIDGKNFIKNIDEKDKDIFFGPNEEFIDIQLNWCMAHIMHNIGLFKSITQARKNGWDKPIPEGFTKMSVGKKAKKQNVFILNIKEIK